MMANRRTRRSGLREVTRLEDNNNIVAIAKTRMAVSSING
jgi:hypothetical protein